MFLGEFARTIDKKGRLALPAKFRDELAAGVVVTRGVDRCLFVFTREKFNELAERIAALPTITNPTARTFSRLLFSGAADCVPDEQGRIVLPQYLREYAGLVDGEVVVVGLHTRLEIWNPEAWEGTRSTLEEDASFAAQFAELGI